MLRHLKVAYNGHCSLIHVHIVYNVLQTELSNLSTVLSVDMVGEKNKLQELNSIFVMAVKEKVGKMLQEVDLEQPVPLDHHHQHTAIAEVGTINT